MTRIKKKVSKMLAVLLSVVLITSSVPPRAVEASWFSDIFGGMFTIITAPIWIFCPNNPTFRKNNPFRQKAWEEETLNEYVHPFSTPKNKKNKYDELMKDLQREREKREELEQKLQRIVKEIPDFLNTFLNQNRHLFKGDRGDNGETPTIENEVISTIVMDIINKNIEKFKGADGKDGEMPQIDYDKIYKLIESKIYELIKANADSFRRPQGAAGKDFDPTKPSPPPSPSPIATRNLMSWPKKNK